MLNLRHGDSPCTGNVMIMLYGMTMLSAMAMLHVLLYSPSHDHVHVMFDAPSQGHALCNGVCSQRDSGFGILPTPLPPLIIDPILL